MEIVPPGRMGLDILLKKSIIKKIPPKKLVQSSRATKTINYAMELTWKADIYRVDIN